MYFLFSYLSEYMYCLLWYRNVLLVCFSVGMHFWFDLVPECMYCLYWCRNVFIVCLSVRRCLLITHGLLKHQNAVIICFRIRIYLVFASVLKCTLFSSPEPKAHGELL